MIHRRVVLTTLFALAACSAHPSAAPSGTSASSSSSSSGGGGGPVDAGWNAAAACDAPDASPTLKCGTLAFAKSSVTSRPRNHHVTLLIPTGAGPMLYAIGGANSQTSVLTNVDRFAINADGSLAASTPEQAIPVASGGHVGDFVSGAIVIAGGTTLGGVTDKAYSTVVHADGSLAAWKPAGSVLNPRMHAGSFAKGGTMWILGGFSDPNVWSDIVSATVQPDGTVSAWAPAGQLPGPRSHFSVTLVDDYVYIAGGLAQSAFANPPDLGDVWRGQILPDGTVGAWTQMTNLPVPEATHASFYYGGHLHVCGGITDAPAQEDRCWRAPIEADHTLGAFEEIATLPIARAHVHQMPVFGLNVYSIAGAIDFNLDSTTQIDVGTFEMTGLKAKIKPRATTEPGAPAHKGPKCHLGG